jgi:hypothetical protein
MSDSNLPVRLNVFSPSSGSSAHTSEWADISTELVVTGSDEVKIPHLGRSDPQWGSNLSIRSLVNYMTNSSFVLSETDDLVSSIKLS